MTKKITVAYGDGIGPEIMESALLVLQGAKLILVLILLKLAKKFTSRAIILALRTILGKKSTKLALFLKLQSPLRKAVAIKA